MRIPFVLLLFFSCLFSSVTLSSTPLGVKDFMADPSIYDMDISPNGHYLAEVRRKGNINVVVIRDFTKPGLPIMGMLGDDITRPYSVIWANDERLIIHLLVPYDTARVRRKSTRDDDFDIHDYFMFKRSISVDVHGKNPVSLMGDRHSDSWQTNLSDIRHLLPDDPQHILMSSDRNDRLSLFKVNIYDGTSELLVSGTRKTVYFKCDTKGNPKYREDYYPYRKQLRIFEYKGKDEWAEIDQIEFDPDRKDAVDLQNLVGLLKNSLIYRKKNAQTGFYELVEKARNGSEAKVIASEPGHDILNLVFDYGNDEVIGYAYETDSFAYHYFDAQLQKDYDKLRTKFGGYGFHLVSQDKLRKQAIIEAYGPDTPGNYFIYDQEKDRLDFYGNAYEALIPEAIGISAVTTYLSRDQTQIRMYLLLPPGYQKDKAYPLVVMPHGGPQARDYAVYDDYAALIASQGYIVARPNFRGSTGYGKTFEEAGYKQWGGLMQDDLQDAVNFLVRKGLAKQDKVCIVGGSYGGYAALMGTIKSPETYRCAISINGVTQLRDQIKFDLKRFKDEPDVGNSVLNSIGDPKVDSELLDVNSPLLQADKIKVPLLLISGTRDEVVPHSQSKDLYKAMHKHKQNVTWVPLKDAYHNAFWYRDDRETIYTKTIAFLAQYLQ